MRHGIRPVARRIIHQGTELNFISAYALTVILETGMLFLLMRKRYPAGTIIMNSVISNSITLPFVWFFFPILGLEWPVQIAISEMFAFICEAVYYKTAFAKLGWTDSIIASFLCNSLSFGVGLLLM